MSCSRHPFRRTWATGPFRLVGPWPSEQPDLGWGFPLAIQSHAGATEVETVSPQLLKLPLQDRTLGVFRNPRLTKQGFRVPGTPGFWGNRNRCAGAGLDIGISFLPISPESDLATPAFSPGPGTRPSLGLRSLCHGELNKMGMCSLTPAPGLLQLCAFQQGFPDVSHWRIPCQPVPTAARDTFLLLILIQGYIFH